MKNFSIILSSVAVVLAATSSVYTAKHGSEGAASPAAIEEALKAAGHRCSVEGETKADWVLIDAFDVIVHIFRPEVREFYNLEKMWTSVANLRKE